MVVHKNSSGLQEMGRSGKIDDRFTVNSLSASQNISADSNH